jgi:hypothetical protein
MSAGEKSEKTSSADSGSSQNYNALVRKRTCEMLGESRAYTSPVAIVGWDLLGLRQTEDALFEAKFGVGRTHLNSCHITLGMGNGYGWAWRCRGIAMLQHANSTNINPWMDLKDASHARNNNADFLA